MNPAPLRLRPWAVLLATGFAFPVASAQSGPADSLPALVVSTTVDTSRHIPADWPLEFLLSRALADGEGELAILVGGVDVTALAERSAQRLLYRPSVAPLPAGNTDVVVYQKRGSQWTELRRVALKVLTPAGFLRVALTPSATLGNKGQLAEGRSTGIPDPDRPTYQDFVLNGTLTTTHEAPRFTIETSSEYMGVSRREEALRFGQRQDRAPRMDLSAYRVTIRSGGTAFTLGHTSFGASRHLVNGFSSRGASLSYTRGGTQVAVGALNAAPMVGWDHLVGLTQPNHRIMGLSLGQELITTKPGALRVEATLLDASMLPINGFTQGGVLDAEANAGGSVQVAAATPGQRLRFSGGYSRSRFDNPARDPELLGDTVVRAVQRETRGARYVEANVAPVQNATVKGLGAVNVGLGFRHERVDPLYKSVAAPVQADRQQNAADANITLGALSGQLGYQWSRDNLADVATILTTMMENSTANLALTMAQLVKAQKSAQWWPTLTFALNRTHQHADELPAGGVFRAQDMPDQLSTISDLGAQWQLGRWRVGARRNRAHQDNRQDQRQNADFTSGSDALTLGTSFGTAADVSLDLGDDFQRSDERGERTDTRRLTLNTNLRRGQSTSVVLAISLLRTEPPTGPATVNGEQRVEIMQPLAFLRDASGGARGQVFLRFGRSTARLPDFALLDTNPMAQRSERRWALASGLNLRVF